MRSTSKQPSLWQTYSFHRFSVRAFRVRSECIQKELYIKRRTTYGQESGVTSRFYQHTWILKYISRPWPRHLAGHFGFDSCLSENGEWLLASWSEHRMFPCESTSSLVELNKPRNLRNDIDAETKPTLVEEQVVQGMDRLTSLKEPLPQGIHPSFLSQSDKKLRWVVPSQGGRIKSSCICGTSNLNAIYQLYHSFWKNNPVTGGGGELFGRGYQRGYISEDSHFIWLLRWNTDSSLAATVHVSYALCPTEPGQTNLTV